MQLAGKGNILFMVRVEDRVPRVLSSLGWGGRVPNTPATERPLRPLPRTESEIPSPASQVRARARVQTPPRPHGCTTPTTARQGRGRFLPASRPRATPPGCGSRAPAPRALPEEGAGRGGSARARRRQPGLALTPLAPPRRRPLPPGVEGVVERLLGTGPALAAAPRVSPGPARGGAPVPAQSSPAARASPLPSCLPSCRGQEHR